MQMKQYIANEYIFEPSKSEIAYFMDSLNEILNGFPVKNFEGQVGAPAERVKQLWEKLNTAFRASLKDGDPREVALSNAEMEILCQASRLCIEVLGESEFSTRLGESIPFALKLVDTLKIFLG
jgi:hypothetical protein